MKKLLIFIAVIFAISLFSYDTFYELIEDYSANAEITNFIGYVEMGEARLADLVPDSFPNSEGDKTWLEYAKLVYPLDFGVKLTVGWRDDNANLTHIITSEEFYLWADYWGIENFVLPNDKGIKTIAQMPIMGSKRMVIGANPAIDTEQLVAITVNNAFISPFYVVEGIEFSQDILNLLVAAQQTGATTVTMGGLLGYTTILINIDNVTPEIMQYLIIFNGAIHVDWLDQHNLCTEVDAPNDKIIKYNAEGTKGLISLKGKTWDEIRFTETPLFWDKYTLEY